MEDTSNPVPNLSPSSDYALNAFLLDIANEITDEELEDLKFLVSGDYGISKRALEKITRPIHLFTALRERGLLNSNNLLTLQSMLWHIKKRNLLQRYVDFAENIGVPYFVVPNDTPENGYTYVHFHIKGKGLCQLKRTQLEELRMKIAEILHVPPKFIIIAGIQASNSLVITFMVPREFTYLLRHCKTEHTPVFHLLSVDKWIMDDITVIVEGSKMEEEKHTSTQMEREAQKAIQRYKQIQEALDTKEEEFENFKLNVWFATIFFYEKASVDRYNLHLQMKALLEKTHYSSLDSLQKTSVLTYFRYMLKVVRRRGYDEDVISSLLEAHSLVFQWQRREKKDILINDLQLEIQRLQLKLRDLQVDLTVLKWQKDKLAFYFGIKEKHRILSASEEFFLTVICGRIPIAKIGVTPECMEYIFRNLAHDITKSNMKALIRESTLTGKELEESKHSAYALLQNTFRQKKTQLGQSFEFGQFLREFFKPIQRSGLEQKASHYLGRYHFEELLKQSQISEKSAEPQIQPGTPKRQRYHSESTVGKREESLPNSLEERLTKIEGMLERIEKSSSELHLNPLEKYESMLESSGVKSKYKGLLMPDLFPLNI
ncbi:uncharacterized protein LOC134249699 [Saccostrea cucullata]|uniref:uncharacterized protein LOC134249699 n=1 Tax=Saccostrea cuccullata TaxID=36930 RepID=UPI002ED22A8F